MLFCSWPGVHFICAYFPCRLELYIWQLLTRKLIRMESECERALSRQLLSLAAPWLNLLCGSASILHPSLSLCGWYYFSANIPLHLWTCMISLLNYPKERRLFPGEAGLGWVTYSGWAVREVVIPVGSKWTLEEPLRFPARLITITVGSDHPDRNVSFIGVPGKRHVGQDHIEPQPAEELPKTAHDLQGVIIYNL